MRAVDVVDKLLGEGGGVVGCAGWNKVGKFGESADNYEDGRIRWVLGGR